MLTGNDATLAVVDALDALGIPYMVVGSLSSNVYGVDRATRDADFVIQLGNKSVRGLADHLGPPLRLDPQLSFETMTMTNRHILDVIGIPFKIELFHLSDDPHDQERFRRRCRVPALGREVSLPTAEDVIVTKLRWVSCGKRSKDWDVIRNVIAVQADCLDWDYIYRWCEQHGTRAVLDEIRASIPPI